MVQNTGILSKHAATIATAAEFNNSNIKFDNTPPHNKIFNLFHKFAWSGTESKKDVASKFSNDFKDLGDTDLENDNVKSSIEKLSPNLGEQISSSAKKTIAKSMTAIFSRTLNYAKTCSNELKNAAATNILLPALVARAKAGEDPETILADLRKVLLLTPEIKEETRTDLNNLIQELKRAIDTKNPFLLNMAKSQKTKRLQVLNNLGKVASLASNKELLNQDTARTIADAMVEVIDEETAHTEKLAENAKVGDYKSKLRRPNIQTNIINAIGTNSIYNKLHESDDVINDNGQLFQLGVLPDLIAQQLADGTVTADQMVAFQRVYAEILKDKQLVSALKGTPQGRYFLANPPMKVLANHHNALVKELKSAKNREQASATYDKIDKFHAIIKSICSSGNLTADDVKIMSKFDEIFKTMAKSLMSKYGRGLAEGDVQLCHNGLLFCGIGNPKERARLGLKLLDHKNVKKLNQVDKTPLHLYYRTLGKTKSADSTTAPTILKAAKYCNVLPFYKNGITGIFGNYAELENNAQLENNPQLENNAKMTVTFKIVENEVAVNLELSFSNAEALYHAKKWYAIANAEVKVEDDPKANQRAVLKDTLRKILTELAGMSGDLARNYTRELEGEKGAYKKVYDPNWLHPTTIEKDEITAPANRDKAMWETLIEKCKNADFKAELLATGDADLQEHRAAKRAVDNHFSDGHDGKGDNMLGLMLMRLRAEIRNKGAEFNSNDFNPDFPLDIYEEVEARREVTKANAKHARNACPLMIYEPSIKRAN
jgi:hypothetical protein